MSRMRHDLMQSGRQSRGKPAAEQPGRTAQRTRLVVAIVVLVAACVLVVYQLLPESRPALLTESQIQEPPAADAGVAPGHPIPAEPQRPPGSGKRIHR